MPIKGSTQNYDPINYDDYLADKYGGFGGDNAGNGGNRGNNNNNNNNRGGGGGGSGNGGGNGGQGKNIITLNLSVKNLNNKCSFDV